MPDLPRGSSAAPRFVPEHVGDYGRAMVLDNDDFKAVFKGVLGDAVF